MIRHATYTLEDVFAAWATRNERKPQLADGTFVKGNARLRLFSTKGVACVRCPAVGAFFALESHGAETPHLNLYGFKESGKEVLMTKDHIIRKAKGGPNADENYQPMCADCNRKKADTL